MTEKKQEKKTETKESLKKTIKNMEETIFNLKTALAHSEKKLQEISKEKEKYADLYNIEKKRHNESLNANELIQKKFLNEQIKTSDIFEEFKKLKKSSIALSIFSFTMGFVFAYCMVKVW